MSDDWEYLRRFRDSGDSEAFAEIVRRYIDLVWATGHRITGDADLARDVAQIVFSDLARKAGRLSEETILAGWLHRAASFAASRAVRDAARRRTREKAAMEMQSLQSNQSPEERAEHLLPHLDEAIGELRQKDREAVLLRYFGRKSLAEIGEAIGVSEDAAQKRIARALERLRARLRRRGLEASGAFMIATLSAAGSQAAPTGVAVAVAASSVTVAGAAGAGLASSWLAHIPTSIAFMKTPVVTTALVAATAVAPLVYQEYQRSRLSEANARLEAQAAELPAWRAASADQERRRQLAFELAKLREGREELTNLRAEAASLRTQNIEQKTELQRRLSSARATLADAQAQTAEVEERIQSQELALRRVSDLKNLGLAARVWARDNNDRLPPTFRDMTNEIGIHVDFETFVEPYEYIRPEGNLRDSEYDPRLILFREKEPRRMPDGTWQRAYTFLDGSVQQIGSETGDFSEWERKHMEERADRRTASSEK